MTCPTCSTRNPDTTTSCVSCEGSFLFSVVTGRPLVELEVRGVIEGAGGAGATCQPAAGPQYWICGTCKHRASEAEITPLRHCPLCHAPA